jgi:hypothetical protein
MEPDPVSFWCVLKNCQRYAAMIQLSASISYSSRMLGSGANTNDIFRRRSHHSTPLVEGPATSAVQSLSASPHANVAVPTITWRRKCTWIVLGCRGSHARSLHVVPAGQRRLAGALRPRHEGAVGDGRGVPKDGRWKLIDKFIEVEPAHPFMPITHTGLNSLEGSAMESLDQSLMQPYDLGPV